MAGRGRRVRPEDSLLGVVPRPDGRPVPARADAAVLSRLQHLPAGQLEQLAPGLHPKEQDVLGVVRMSGVLCGAEVEPRLFVARVAERMQIELTEEELATLRKMDEAKGREARRRQQPEMRKKLAVRARRWR